MTASDERSRSTLDRLRARLKNGWKLVRDPAGWSADWYRRSNKMYYSATMPETWRDREDVRVPDEPKAD